MLDKVVFPVAGMAALLDTAYPILELPVPFVLMSHPIGFAFERLGLVTILECACEGLDILMHMLCPVAGFVELLDLEAQWTFELGR
jgi:hypothetical protein